MGGHCHSRSGSIAIVGGIGPRGHCHSRSNTLPPDCFRETLLRVRRSVPRGTARRVNRLSALRAQTSVSMNAPNVVYLGCQPMAVRVLVESIILPGSGK